VTGQTAAPTRTQIQLGPRFSWTNALLILAALAVIGWSLNGTQFSLLTPFEENNLKSVARFIGGLLPPDLSPPFLGTVGRLMLQTIQISIVGTVLAIGFGFLLAIGAMRRRGEDASRSALGMGPWLGRWGIYATSRSVLNILRSVPELVWALIFVVAVGLGPVAGVLALAAHSTGVLGKLYAELFESVDQRLVEAGRSTGGTDLGVLLMIQLPAMLPVLLSYTLFRWECNMRAATLLGFVGAGGIGSQLTISMKLYQYHEVATLALSILVLVILVDIVGTIIRSRVLDAPTNACAPLLADQ
jgi:phosphonate transport system permease protein